MVFQFDELEQARLFGKVHVLKKRGKKRGRESLSSVLTRL